MEPTDSGISAPNLPDDITVKHWLAFYVVFFAALAIPLGWLLARQGWSWTAWTEQPAETFSRAAPAVKLLVLTLYASIACTFLPMPTGWIIAGVATRQAAVAAGLAGDPQVQALLTALIIAVCGGIGSTVANLNDYHLFTWMLRRRRIAAVRDTRTYRSAARWFARQPTFLLVLFNIIPIPVDFVRILAISYRYPRWPFAIANFVGRFIRYFIIALVTFWWDLGIAAPIALLVLALVLGSVRLVPKAIRRIFGRPANQPAREMSNQTASQE